MTDGLAEFLLARIAEDERVAQLSISHGTGGFPTAYWQRLWNGPGNYPVMAAQRLLAECDAKRRIIRTFTGGGILRLLALPYADHEDYHDKWRP